MPTFIAHLLNFWIVAMYTLISCFLYKLTYYPGPGPCRGALALWLMFARRLTLPKSWHQPPALLPTRPEPQTNILHLSTRHFWFGASFYSAAKTRNCAYLLGSHPGAHMHARTYIRTFSEAYASIFYHNFGIARLINLFAKNIFTSFIRKHKSAPLLPLSCHLLNCISP